MRQSPHTTHVANRRWLGKCIHRVSGANPLWGTPRIVGELAKLGIKVAKATVDKYLVRSRKAPVWTMEEVVMMTDTMG